MLSRLEEMIFNVLTNRNQIFAFFCFQSFAKKHVVERCFIIIIITNNDGLDIGNLIGIIEVPPGGCFREEVENVKLFGFRAITL